MVVNFRLFATMSLFFMANLIFTFNDMLPCYTGKQQYFFFTLALLHTMFANISWKIKHYEVM
jgi:hypothetical protein